MHIEKEKITLKVPKDVARRLREMKNDLVFLGYKSHAVCMGRVVEVLVLNHLDEARQYLSEEKA